MITWQWSGELHSLKSKHRSVNACSFQGVDFKVPEKVITKYGVEGFDFIYTALLQVVRDCHTSVAVNHDGPGRFAATRTYFSDALPARHQRRDPTDGQYSDKEDKESLIERAGCECHQWERSSGVPYGGERPSQQRSGGG